jgi:hypothetical protein
VAPPTNAAKLPDTNVTINMIHQETFLRSWWAKTESKTNVGLGPRFVFSHAQRQQTSERAHERFVQVLEYIVQQI